MAGISSHEGRFELFGPKRIPLLGYTIEDIKNEDARVQGASGPKNEYLVSGEFERSDRSGDVKYKAIYSEETSSSFNFTDIGIKLSWAQLPTNERGVYIYLAAGYQVPDKELVLTSAQSQLSPSELQKIDKSSARHYYIVVATNRKPDPQDMNRSVGKWQGFNLTIEPRKLDPAPTYAKVYHAMAHDAHHQNPDYMALTELRDIEGNGTFQLTADEVDVGCYPSGMYIFGEPGQVEPVAAGATHPDYHFTPPFNINFASEEELDELPGIGPAIAKRIIDGGVYESKEDLIARVIGISESVYSTMARGRDISFAL